MALPQLPLDRHLPFLRPNGLPQNVFEPIQLQRNSASYAVNHRGNFVAIKIAQQATTRLHMAHLGPHWSQNRSLGFVLADSLRDNVFVLAEGTRDKVFLLAESEGKL